MKINDRKIGPGEPVFIIAELSANHGQDFSIALDTIHAMREAGADAVKLQTYRPDTITLESAREYFQINQGTIWDGKTLYQLYTEAATPWDWYPRLRRAAEALGLICFSSPFDKTAIDYLQTMDVPAYKIASFEITDIPLIRYAASKGKPIILSTGIAELPDIEEAVAAIRETGNTEIAILKCASVYPTPFEELNLRAMPYLAERFGVPVGLSDHTTGHLAAVAATALGASIIEKHFILDKALGGPDAAFSLDPAEFAAMVKAVRDAERALGRADYTISERVGKSREHARSLFAVKSIQAHEPFTEANVKSIRPGFGLHPRYLTDIVGKKAKAAIEKGTPLSWDMIAD
ncbi:pseudaminic acid synthase [Candidatus Magnetominusculus xianensis]|uniref:N-acetylneuraminate synthase n=1 Tax=Candidatus Magnetominusculus xianensis TaxID=1748249 RepID=A0ABR5SK87_9BACT|nr:pseudaminic acid synthase [Candidatus Magnetominusculus xianensis]KWT93413.1 N-acetylneuraminate synthase [Candidatus Magnetominusculus xianensis]MBF0404773.1 pseudaminic acid synthase [Nitrospirota bacterium]